MLETRLWSWIHWGMFWQLFALNQVSAIKQQWASKNVKMGFPISFRVFSLSLCQSLIFLICFWVTKFFKKHVSLSYFYRLLGHEALPAVEIFGGKRAWRQACQSQNEIFRYDESLPRPNTIFHISIRSFMAFLRHTICLGLTFWLDPLN